MCMAKFAVETEKMQTIEKIIEQHLQSFAKLPMLKNEQ